MTKKVARCFPLLIALAASACAVAPARASLVYFTDLASFDAASDTSIVEDFESVGPVNTPLSSFTSHGNTYTGLAGLGSPNVYIYPAGATNFGVPITTSTVLTANGDEDIRINFGSPTNALGFDTYLNRFGPATIQVLGAGGLLGTYTLNHAPTVVGFFGVVSDAPIVAIRWTTVNGASVNTGFDNIRVGVAAVPEPSGLLSAGGGGIALIGVARRRTRRS